MIFDKKTDIIFYKKYDIYDIQKFLDIYKYRLKFIFHLNRNTKNIGSFVYNSSSESLLDTAILLFWKRDCRGGQGEREIFRKAHERLTLIDEYKNKNLWRFIPEYGRYDDFIRYAPIENVYELFCNDYENMLEGKSVSLLSKWMPTEGNSYDRETGYVSKFCKKSNMTHKEYRKKLSNMRTYIYVIESIISKNDWNVEYEKIPSKALRLLENSFKIHSYTKFKHFMEQNIKLNTFNFKNNLLVFTPSESFDSFEKYWRFLLKRGYTIFNKNEHNPMIPIVNVFNKQRDNIDVITFLGLYISGCNKKPFSNRLLSFSSKPQWYNTNNTKSFQYNLDNILSTPTDNTINLYEAFKLIIEICKEENVKMPNLVIFSTTPTDDFKNNNIKVDLDKTRKLIKKELNCHLPLIIFWNISSSLLNFSALEDMNLLLISGFSYELFTFLIKNGELNPISFVQNILDSPRYKYIKNAF